MHALFLYRSTLNSILLLFGMHYLDIWGLYLEI